MPTNRITIVAAAVSDTSSIFIIKTKSSIHSDYSVVLKRVETLRITFTPDVYLLWLIPAWMLKRVFPKHQASHWQGLFVPAQVLILEHCYRFPIFAELPQNRFLKSSIFNCENILRVGYSFYFVVHLLKRFVVFEQPKTIPVINQTLFKSHVQPKLYYLHVPFRL